MSSILQIFSSQDELCQWTQDEGKRLGFAIIFAKSDGGGHNKRERIKFGCEHGRQLRFKKIRDMEEF